MTELDLKQACDYLEGMLTSQQIISKEIPTDTVTYFLGKKPSGYYVPKFVATTKGALSEKMNTEPVALFAEVFVNRKCIFRESYIPQPTEDEEICKGVVMTRLFHSIFAYGVMASKKVMHDYDNWGK